MAGTVSNEARPEPLEAKDWAAKLNDAIFSKNAHDVQQASQALSTLAPRELDRAMPTAAMFFAQGAVIIAEHGGSPSAGDGDAICTLLVENEEGAALELLSIERARASAKTNSEQRAHYAARLGAWTALAFAAQGQNQNTQAFLFECLNDPELDWTRDISQGGIGPYTHRFGFKPNENLAQAAARLGGPSGALAALASGADVAELAMGAALQSGRGHDFIELVQRIGPDKARSIDRMTDLQETARGAGFEWLYNQELFGTAPMSRNEARSAVAQCKSIPELFDLSSKVLGPLRMAWGDAPTPSLALAEAWGSMSHIIAVTGPTLRLGYSERADQITAEQAIHGALDSAKAALAGLLAPTGDGQLLRSILVKTAEDSSKAFFHGVDAPATSSDARRAIAGASFMVGLRNKASWAEVAHACAFAPCNEAGELLPLHAAIESAKGKLAQRGFSALRIAPSRRKPLPLQLADSMDIFENAFSLLPMAKETQGLKCIQWAACSHSPFFQGSMSSDAPIMDATTSNTALHEYGHAIDFWCSANMGADANPMSEHKRILASRLNSLPLSDFSNLAQSCARRMPSLFRRHAHELDAEARFNGKLLESNYHRQPTEMAARSFELIGAAKGMQNIGDFRHLPQAAEADEALASIKTLLSAVENNSAMPSTKISEKLAKHRGANQDNQNNPIKNNEFESQKNKRS